MAQTTVGIRREDKNEWERRAPLTPADVHTLVGDGVEVAVQPSTLRVFPDEEYLTAGATVAEDLSGCGLVLAVKEIPLEFFQANTTYVFFSHTLKGQPHNMPLLQRILDLGSTLIDYEAVVDAQGSRLLHFGRFAGIAGAVDGLWTLGRRLQQRGQTSAFGSLKPAWTYPDLRAAFGAVADVGAQIARDGVANPVGPIVVGISGSGNVAGGVQEVMDRLPVQDVAPADLTNEFLRDASVHVVHRVAFKEEDTVERLSGDAFDPSHYRQHPDQYRSRFARYLPYLSMLVNCIYWDHRAPRLVARSDLQNLFGADPDPRLAVIADLSCDIEGGIECTVRATTPDSPVYVYDPATGRAADGVAGNGVVILAVDHLPCELPRDASASFSRALLDWVPSLAATDFGQPFASLALPPEWKAAVVAHAGQLAPDYAHLRPALGIADH